MSNDKTKNNLVVNLTSFIQRKQSMDWGVATVLHEQWTLSGRILGKSEFYRAFIGHDWLGGGGCLYTSSKLYFLG